MDRTVLPRAADVEDMPKGSWYPVKPTALVKCGGCGIKSVMSKHTIDADGTVNASIGCPKNCGWHIWGILADWPKGQTYRPQE